MTRQPAFSVAINDPLGNIAARQKELARSERRRHMTATESLFDEAKTLLTQKLSDALSDLAEHDADREKFPPQYYQSRRAELLRAVNSADGDAMRALEAYTQAARDESRKLRSAAEAAIPSAERVAAMQEAKLLSETRDVERLTQEAVAMLEDDQPERAAILLQAAQMTGSMPAPRAEMVRQPDGSVVLATVHPLQRLSIELDEALDAKDDNRKAARDIEAGIARNMANFRNARLTALMNGGVGIRPTGEPGTGSQSDVASASANQKVAAYIEAQARGETYTGGAE